MSHQSPEWDGHCNMLPIGEPRNGRVRKRCTYCGLTLPLIAVDKVVISRCPVGPSVDESPPPRLLRNYSRAIAKWVKAGRPRRSDGEVAAILEICHRCSLFENGGCKKCGCRVNTRKSALANKLRMATESCPIDRW